MKVTTIVLTFNNQDSIEVCLRSLVEEKPDEILVIDSGSSDRTMEIVSKNFVLDPRIPLQGKRGDDRVPLRLIKLSENVGYAKGNNLGIKEALKGDPDFVLILNPDTKLFPRTVDRLIQSAKQYDNKGIFGSTILQKDGKTIWSMGGELDEKRWTAKLIGYNNPSIPPLSKRGGVRPECEFISGTCMLIPRELLEKGLRFYEKYFMYYEDIEFCLRAKKLGFPSIIVPQAKIVHFETSEINNPTLPPLKLRGGEEELRRGWTKDYYLARNHLLFVERNAPNQVKLRELIRLPKTLSEHWQHNNSQALLGVKDYFLRRFGQ